MSISVLFPRPSFLRCDSPPPPIKHNRLNKESAYASSLLGSEDRRRRYRDLPLSSTTDATSLSQMMAALDSGAAGGAYVANARTCMPTIGSAVPLLLPWSRLVPLGPKTVEALSVGAWVKLKMVTPIVTKVLTHVRQGRPMVTQVEGSSCLLDNR